MKRRDFLLKLGGVPLVAVAANYLTGCSGSNGYSQTTTPSPAPAPSPGSTGGTPNCKTNGGMTVVAASNGHTHPSTNVPASDILTATQQTYTVPDGGIGHTHTFTVPATNYTTLQGNSSVTVTTNADSTGHSHSITINCI